jgi:hypothetical protein
MPAPDNPISDEAAALPSPAAPEPASPPPARARLRIDAPTSHLLAWAGLAIVNAVAIALIPLPRDWPRIRTLQHVYDAGHLMALGFLAWSASTAWMRFGPERPRYAYAALAIASATASMLLLRGDLAGFAERMAGDDNAEPLLSILTIIASMSVPMAHAAGRLVARGRLRAIGVGLAILGGAANAKILQNDYPGVHFYIAWVSATLGAAAIAGAVLPARIGAPGPRGRRAWLIARVVIALTSVFTLIVWPSSAVLIELYKLDSAVVVPILARVRARASAGRASIPPEMQPWFVDRSKVDDVPPSAPRLLPPDGSLILITIDSLRADVIASNANRAALPNLFALRDSGVYFPQARSPGSGTRITLGTVFSGRYYAQLTWHDPLSNRPRLDSDRSVRWPELLTAAGVMTMTYVSERAVEGKVGIARGFTEETWINPMDGQRFALSDALIGAATARLREHKGGPFFLYMHLMDPHYPYDAAGTQGSPNAAYMREVMLVDRSIGQLWRALVQAGLWEKTAIVIAADHGEAFGQHNTPNHNSTLYEELLRVPLIIRVPGVPARRVPDVVSLVDVGPTALDLMGLPTPGAFMGESLVPMLRGQTPALTRPLIAERRYAQAMLFPDGTKVILDWQKGTEELYDLTRDPGETKNLCDELGAACAAKLDVLRAFFFVHGRWR